MFELKLLRVDLTNGSFKEQIIGEDLVRKWLGGRGLGAYLALKEIPKGADPLGPENKLYILTGPATGTLWPLSGRYHVIGKSPLTGILGESNSGGEFGPWLRFSGYDGVVLEGASDEPVYLTIKNGEPELHPAKHIWGKGTVHTEKIVREEVGEKERGSVLCIGPAGENLVKIAAVMNDMYRAAGRTGLGAVMGSKKLKAIFVVGDRKPPVHDVGEFTKVVMEKRKVLEENPVTGQGLPAYGTAILVNIVNTAGIFPTRNFQTGIFEHAEKISGEKLAETYLLKNKGCWGCTVQCSRVTKVPEAGFYQTPVGEGPEYETVWALGANLGIGNLAAIIKANYLINELGMDTISFGNAVATAMYLYQEGKLTLEDTDGIEFKWGNEAALIEAIYRTAYRNGFGDDLAEGAARLANKYGDPDAAIHIRNLTLPAYDPRGVKAHALAYATANRGGCHLRAYMISQEILGIPEKFDPFEKNLKKVKATIETQNYFAVIDSLVVCKFLTFAHGPDHTLDLLRALTGWDITIEEMLTIGERVYNAERLFSVKEGKWVKDYLPKRLVTTPMPEGPAKGHTADVQDMIEDYWKLRGWEEGKPKAETLKRLGLDEFLGLL